VLLTFLLSLDVVEGVLHGPDLAGAVLQLSHSLAVLIPIPDEVIIFLVVLLFWQRGSTLAGSPELSWGREGFHFRIGVLLYAVYIAARKDVEGAVIPELLPTFFLASMLAIAVARANSLVHQAGGSRAPISLRWMGGLGALLVAVTALGIGTGYVLDSHAVRQGVLLIGLGIGAVLGFAFKIMLPILMLLNPVLQLLVGFLRRLFEGLGDVMEEVQVNVVSSNGPPASEPQPTPEWIQFLSAAWPYIQWALVILVAVGLIIIVTRGRRRWRPDWVIHASEDEDLERSGAVMGRPGLLEGAPRRLAAWMRSVVDRSWLAPFVIRRLYIAMLNKAAKDGRPRWAHETPAEFGQVLKAMYPSAAAAVSEITGAYELVRYGLRPEAPEAVARVRSAWSALKKASP
jgi:hypothetical protein